jgi:hypothetical protein
VRLVIAAVIAAAVIAAAVIPTAVIPTAVIIASTIIITAADPTAVTSGASLCAVLPFSTIRTGFPSGRCSGATFLAAEQPKNPLGRVDIVICVVGYGRLPKCQGNQEPCDEPAPFCHRRTGSTL